MAIRVTLTEKQVCDFANQVANLRRSKPYRHVPITRIISKVVQHVPQAQPFVAAELGKRGAQKRALKARELRARAKLEEQAWQEYLAERFTQGARHAAWQRRDHLLPEHDR